MSATRESGQLELGLDGDFAAANPARTDAPPKRQKLMGPGGDPLTGRARSTTSSRQSHINKFNSLMDCKLDMYEEADFQDEDSLKLILAEFTDALVHGGLSTRSTETGPQRSFDYLCNIFYTVTDEFVSRFPRTPGVVALKAENYYTECRQKLKKLYNRHFETGSQEDGLITKTMPIFREISMRGVTYLTANIHAGFDAGDVEMKPVAIDLATMGDTLTISVSDDPNFTPIKFRHTKKLALSLEWQFVSRADEPASSL